MFGIKILCILLNKTMYQIKNASFSFYIIS